MGGVWAWRGVTVLLVVVNGGIGVGMVAHALRWPSVTDFAALLSSARSFSWGGCPYIPADQLKSLAQLPGAIPPPTPNLLPFRNVEVPLQAWLLQPLTHLPLEVSMAGMIVFLAMVMSGIWLTISSRFGLSRHGLALCVVLCFNAGALTNLLLGQVEPVILAAILGGATLLRKDRTFFGGLLIGLSTVKPQIAWAPAVALAVTHQWRAIAGFALAAVIVVVTSLTLVTASCLAAWLVALNDAGPMAPSIGFPALIAKGFHNSAGAYTSFVVLAGAVTGVLHVFYKRYSVPVDVLVLLAAGMAVPFALHALQYDYLLIAPTGGIVAVRRPATAVALGASLTPAYLVDLYLPPLIAGLFGALIMVAFIAIAMRELSDCRHWSPPLDDALAVPT